jgi:thioredoxin reductase (NADPH)
MPTTGKTRPASSTSSFAERSRVVTETDALIVGAGPVGLFQAFELGLLEMGAQIVDSLPCAGGQCAELYADKPIYDIPALPRCTGRELVDRLLQQLAPFKPGLHLGQEVQQLRRQADGRFAVQTSAGTQFLAKTVFIAGGVGSFQPRTLKVPGLEAFAGGQLRYRLDDSTHFAGQRVVVVGGDEVALDTALRLSQAGPGAAASVLLLHRREVFDATADTLARLRAARDTGVVRFVAGQVAGFAAAEGRLSHLDIAAADGSNPRVALDQLLVCLGLSPRLGPIAAWGLALDRKQLVVDTARFETNEPGIFAVGDIVHYPGKRKLIVSGFHEATLAAFAAAAIVRPEQPVLLQYTTTSPRLHELLGVKREGPGAIA